MIGSCLRKLFSYGYYKHQERLIDDHTCFLNNFLCNLCDYSLFFSCFLLSLKISMMLLSFSSLYSDRTEQICEFLADRSSDTEDFPDFMPGCAGDFFTTDLMLFSLLSRMTFSFDLEKGEGDFGRVSLMTKAVSLLFLITPGNFSLIISYVNCVVLFRSFCETCLERRGRFVIDVDVILS